MHTVLKQASSQQSGNLSAFSPAKLFWQQPAVSLKDRREVPIMGVATSVANLRNRELSMAKQVLSVSYSDLRDVLEGRLAHTFTKKSREVELTYACFLRHMRNA